MALAVVLVLCHAVVRVSSFPGVCVVGVVRGTAVAAVLRGAARDAGLPVVRANLQLHARVLGAVVQYPPRRHERNGVCEWMGGRKRKRDGGA